MDAGPPGHGYHARHPRLGTSLKSSGRVGPGQGRTVGPIPRRGKSRPPLDLDFHIGLPVSVDRNRVAAPARVSQEASG